MVLMTTMAMIPRFRLCAALIICAKKYIRTDEKLEEISKELAADKAKG